MNTKAMCEQSVGKWVAFKTQWGQHKGVVQEVNRRGVLIRVPKEYAPVSLLDNSTPDDLKLDFALSTAGYPPCGPQAPGGAYGGAPGAQWGYPGYGAWFGGWWFWWLAFLWILALFFLW